MRTQVLMTVAAAFVLSSVATPPSAFAASAAVKAEEKAAHQSNPAVADDTITKYAAKDAKKQAHKAHKKAKLAAKKAKAAAKDAGAPPASH